MTQATCPQCGRVWNPNARFCGTCGRAVGTVSRAKQRLQRAEVVTPLIHVAPPRFLIRALWPGEAVLASLRGAALPKGSHTKAVPLWLVATSTRLLYGGTRRLARPWVAELAYPQIHACDPWQGAPSPHLALHTAEVTLTVALHGPTDATFLTRLVTGTKAGILFLPPTAAEAPSARPAPTAAPPVPVLPHVAPTARLVPDTVDVRRLAEAAQRVFAGLGFQVRQTQLRTDCIEMEALDPHPLRGGTLLVQCLADGGLVGRLPVQDLERAVQRLGALKGVLVIAGRFAPDARTYAVDKPLVLIERAELDTLLADQAVDGTGQPASHLAATIKLRSS